MAIPVAENVYWVGAVDWEVRHFHGYTYHRIGEVVDPAPIDYVIANHGEPHHSGAIPAVMARAPYATVVHSKRAADSLGKYLPDGWRRQVVGTGDTLFLGRKTLTFVEAPMLHWPDSMFTYPVEEIQQMGLEITTIAPSHGLIWRENPMQIVEQYVRWARGEAGLKALVVYETM